MAFTKLVVLAACLAICNAGFIATPVSYSAPAISSVSQNTYRGYGNIGQVSTYSKALDTPFSSVRKSDIRITNAAIAAAPIAYAAPAFTHSYAPAYTAPVTTYAAAPVAKVVSHPAAIGVAYSAAPAVAHYTFDGFGTHYAF